MARKKISKLLISTMATALLATLTIGVAGISASAETATSTADNNFWVTGGSYSITDPSVAYTKADGTEGTASVGAKIHVVPETAGGEVKLTLKGAHKRYVGASWWGGSIRYRMDDTNVGAVIATYRSNIDAEYAISLITTSAGTYVSLTDDVELIDGVPYVVNSDVGMSVDLTATVLTADTSGQTLLDFRPATKHEQIGVNNEIYAETEMFKEIDGQFAEFNLLNADTITAEKAAVSAAYEYRYTEEWIKQLLSDLSYNDSILELTFVDVAEAGTVMSLLELNGYNYNEAPVNAWNSTPVTTFQAPGKLLVQKTDEVRLLASDTPTYINDLWEVWTPTVESGKTTIEAGVSGAYTLVNTYADRYGTVKGWGNEAFDLKQNNYNVMRPGLIDNPIVYTDCQPRGAEAATYGYPAHVYGRFKVMQGIKYTINGGAEQTAYIQDKTAVRLADFEEFTAVGCPSATWVSGTTYEAGKTFGANDTLSVHNAWDSKIAVTTTDHTKVTFGEAVSPTCTTAGKTVGEKCSVCEAIVTAQAEVPATGHTYGTVKYTWSADKTKCTATAPCGECDDVVTETVDAVKSVTQAQSCTDDELSTMTATFKNEAFAAQTETNVKTGNATGHTYGAVEYTWSADNMKCTATMTCSAGDDVVTETVYAVKTVTQQATTDKVELSKYVATFTNAAFATKTKADVQTGDKLPAASNGDEDSDSTSDSKDAAKTDDSSASSVSCFASVSTLSGVFAVLALAGVAVAIKRRKEN